MKYSYTCPSTVTGHCSTDPGAASQSTCVPSRRRISPLAQWSSSMLYPLPSLLFLCYNTHYLPLIKHIFPTRITVQLQNVCMHAKLNVYVQNASSCIYNSFNMRLPHTHTETQKYEHSKNTNNALPPVRPMTVARFLALWCGWSHNDLKPQHRCDGQRWGTWYLYLYLSTFFMYLY